MRYPSLLYVTSKTIGKSEFTLQYGIKLHEELESIESKIKELGGDDIKENKEVPQVSLRPKPQGKPTDVFSTIKIRMQVHFLSCFVWLNGGF
jgi:hypothetical protein